MSATATKADLKENAKLNKIIHDLIQRILSNTDRRSLAYESTLKLAEVLNQTKTCSDCEGRGWQERHKNCRHDTHDRYVNQCYEHRDCKRCAGCGRVLTELANQ